MNRTTHWADGRIESEADDMRAPLKMEACKALSHEDSSHGGSREEAQRATCRGHDRCWESRDFEGPAARIDYSAQQINYRQDRNCFELFSIP